MKYSKQQEFKLGGGSMRIKKEDAKKYLTAMNKAFLNFKMSPNTEGMLFFPFEDETKIAETAENVILLERQENRGGSKALVKHGLLVKYVQRDYREFMEASFAFASIDYAYPVNVKNLSEILGILGKKQESFEEFEHLECFLVRKSQVLITFDSY